MYKRIYQTGGVDDALVDENVVKTTYGYLNNAVKSGYGQQRDRGVIGALQTNLNVFSVFKSHQEQKAIASLLTKKGKQVAYEEFEQEALKISLNHHKHWLKAEYNAATETAKNIAIWNDVQKTKDRFPYLMYVTKDDDRVRDEHSKWHRHVLPVDHPFWNTHFPVNGFGCRCTVRKLSEADAQAEGITKMKREETYHGDTAFNFNAGKEQAIFGGNHTYFQDLDDETVKQLNEYAANRTFKGDAR